MGDNNNNKRRMTSLSSLLLASSLLGGWHFVPSYGFLLSPRPIIRKYYDSSAIYQYDDGNNKYDDFSNRSNNSNRRKKDTTKNQQTKKRRFAQEIHPQKKFQDFGISYSNTAPTSSSSSSTNKKKKDKKAKTNNNNNNNNNIFLQTSKSIEELERTMTQRYGTKLEQWTFDANNDSEYELVFDDNNNNNNKGRNYSDDDNTRPKRKKGKFKGKPVMDPWAKMGSGTIISDDDDDNEDEENSPPKNKKEKHTKRKLAAAAAAASVAGINPNKETNHQKSNNRNVGPSKLEQKQVKKNSFFQKTEFYDEDDIGYEEENVYDIDIYDSEDDDNTDFYNRVISPKPVGGRGKKKKNVLVEPPRPSMKNNDDDNFGGGGFFSRATQAAAASTSAQEVETPASLKKNHPSNNNNLTTKMELSSDSSEESENIQHSDNDNKKNKKVKKVTKSSPLLDAKGKEMFLTLDHVPSICTTAVIKDASPAAGEEDESAAAATAISWEDIGITHPILLENLRKYMSCPTPLPVQIQSSSAILQNKSDNDSNDIIISTPTGSGKTLAFLVPLVQQLLDEEDAKLQQTSTNNKKKKKPTAKQLRAVVIAPGRELASQIIQVTRDLLRATGMSSQLAIGGTPFTRTMEQIRKKKPTILVGTPGRLAELIVGSSSNDNNGRSNKRIKIPATNHIVLDECDALLGTSTTDDDERASTNNGYSNPHAEPTNAILHALKRQHPSSLKTILCSATATDLILSQEEDDTNGLVKKDKYRNYDMIQLPHQDGLAATTTSPTALHGIFHVPHKRFQLDTLKKILHTHPMPAQVLIFVNTPHRVKIIVQKLAEMGIIAAPFTGDEQKQDRTDVNKALREGYVGIVVATEMAARGIDAPYLTHVINYDLPTDASHYAHRAGRVARGGRPGIVINMTTSARERHVPYSKFAKPLKLENQMFVVEARDGKLPIIGSSNQPKGADSSD